MITLMPVLLWGSVAFGQPIEIVTPAGTVTVQPGPGKSVDDVLAAAREARLAQQIPEWASELAADSYRTRQQATEALLDAGEPAVGCLEKAAAGSDVEAANRAVSILIQLQRSPHVSTSDAAYESLQRVAARKSNRPATRAMATLVRIGQTRLEALGAQVTGRSDVYWVQIGQEWTGGDEGLAALHSLPGVSEVMLGGHISDSGLEHMRGLPDLVSLSLDSPRLTVDALDHLASLPRLGTLALGQTLVTTEGLQKVARLAALKHLQLQSFEFTGKALEELGGHPGLQSLNLYQTGVTPEHLRCLREIPNLKRLHVPQTAMTDEGMKHVGELRGLTSLSVSNTGVTDAGLAEVRSLTDLEYLHISESLITDTGLANLHGLRKLKEVYTRQTFISQTGAERLKQSIPGLKINGRVGIRSLSEPQMQAASRIHRLGGRVVAGYEPGELIVWIGSSCKDASEGLRLMTLLGPVTSVTLGFVVSDQDIEHLTRLEGLKSLWLLSSQLSESGLKQLRESLPNAEITVSMR